MNVMLLSMLMSLASLTTEIKQKPSRFAVVPEEVCRTVVRCTGEVGCRASTAYVLKGQLAAGSS